MTSQINNNEQPMTCPESTIDSALRRDFIRKAALAAAGIGVGATVLGKHVLPEASAKSAKPGSNCLHNYETFVEDCVYVNSNNCNDGPYYRGMIFGLCCSGESITSNRAGSCRCLYGLNFFTDRTNRMAIRNCGKVGIGVGAGAEINQTLTVNGQISASQNVAGVCSGIGDGGIYGSAKKCIGVYGNSVNGPGVIGESCAGFGLYAESPNPVVGKFKNDAQEGDLSALIGFRACNGSANWSVGVAGDCNVQGVPAGDFYIQQCGVSQRMIIDTCGNTIPDPVSSNKGVLYPGPSLIFGGPGSGEGISSNRHSCNPNQYGLDFYTDATCTKDAPRVSITNGGNLGIGTRTPGMSVQVAGSFAAKVATVTTSYSMTASDFGILANAASGALTVTLPPAKTAGGMIVAVKKIDSSTNVVDVKAFGTDKIEGKASDKLKKEYGSLTLISDGSGNWYEIALEKN